MHLFEITRLLYVVCLVVVVKFSCVSYKSFPIFSSIYAMTFSRARETCGFNPDPPPYTSLSESVDFLSEHLCRNGGALLMNTISVFLPLKQKKYRKDNSLRLYYLKT